MIMDLHLGNSSAASTSSATTSLSVAYASALASTFLPWDFVPGSRDVICGKAAKQHSGNEWCRRLVATEMQIYQEEAASGVQLENTATSSATASSNGDGNSSKKPPAIRRRDKTEIVSRVVRKVKNTSPRGGFVKMDTHHGRWVQVPDEHACRMVLEIMQDVMESRRHLRRGPGSPSRASPSNPNIISAGGLPSQSSFLEEYVSKQTAALKDNTSSLFTATGNRGQKRRRITAHRNRASVEHQVPQEDLQLQSFLTSMAAGMPEIVVSNPFEPDPIPSPSTMAAQNQAAVQAQTEAFYESTVARLFENVPEELRQAQDAGASTVAHPSASSSSGRQTETGSPEPTNGESSSS